MHKFEKIYIGCFLQYYFNLYTKYELYIRISCMHFDCRRYMLPLKTIIKAIYSMFALSLIVTRP